MLELHVGAYDLHICTDNKFECLYVGYAPAPNRDAMYLSDVWRLAFA